jgi:hypothetical protein
MTAEMGKLQQAVDLANEVMRGDDFKAAVLRYQSLNMNGNRIVPGFMTTRDSREQVYARLMQGWSVRFCISMPPWYKRWFSKEIARESSDGTVTFDRNKYVRQDLPSLANTVSHECAHVAGYPHSSAQDYDSVPYAIGNLVEQLARAVHAPAVNPALAQAMAAAQAQEGMTL